MKKLAVLAMILMFVAMIAQADDKCKLAGTPACAAKCAGAKTTAAPAGDAKATEADAKNPHAGCAAHASGEVVKTEATAAEAGTAKEVKVEGTPKIAETCPDVGGHSAFETFHSAMSPMHMALEDNKYDKVRAGYADLAKASEGIKTYQCPMNDKCPPECLKSFEGKRADLLKAVDELGIACKGTDDKMVDASFMTMHEAYVQFASMCKHDKPAAEEKPAMEEKK